MKHLSQLENDIINYIIDTIDEYEGTEVSDLHHHLFNTDYWTIGYYEAEQEIKKHCSAWEAIQIVKDYEDDNFGIVSTDLSSSERVCNMLCYILGEEILNDCKAIYEHCDDKLTIDIINKIKEELN